MRHEEEDILMIKTAPFIKMSASILRGPRTIPVAAEFKSEDFLYIPREINNHYRDVK